MRACSVPKGDIDIVSNLGFWSQQMNKLEPLHINNIFQQQQKPLILTQLTDSNFLGKQRLQTPINTTYKTQSE